MYIVRWLMGHPIVAIWVLLGTAMLLALGAGIKDNIIEPEKTSLVISSDSLKIDAVNKAENAIEVTTEPTESVTSEMEDERASVSSSLKAKLDSSEIEKGDRTAAEKKVDAKGAATTDLSQITSEEMLLMAREAYWNNGLDEAAQIYMKLIETEPKVLEHKGELGNVLWRQGYPEKAAELYSEIAIPMIENGGSERVANMIGFIGLFYPDRAAEIHKKMQSKK